MRYTQKALSWLVVLVILALGLPAARVSAETPPPIPTMIWGTARVNGVAVPDGTQIQALVNGVVLATTQTLLYNGNPATYSILVPGDNLSTTPVVGGGKDGEPITFRIGGSNALQTALWSSGTSVHLDLTINATTALADNYTTTEDTPYHVNAPGVLANDTDPDSAPLTAQRVSGPTHGTLTLNTDGSFDYSPAANMNGSDSFTYNVFNGQVISNIAVVSITISPVNDAPSVGSAAFSTLANHALVMNLKPSLADLETPASALVVIIDVQPAHGSLTVADQTVTYTPTAGFTGADSFQYHTRDLGDPTGCTGSTPACSAPLDSPSALVSITITRENTDKYPFKNYLPTIWMK